MAPAFAQGDLFANWKHSAATINVLVRDGKTKELKKLFSETHTKLNDASETWKQIRDAKKYFPACRYLDSTVLYSTDNRANKSLIVYRYQYVTKEESFEFSLYITFNADKRVDIALVKTLRNVLRDAYRDR